MKPESMFLADGTEITLVHFLAKPLYAAPRIACMPGLVDFASHRERLAPHVRTDEARSVNCPLCKATEDYKQAVVSLGVLKR